MLSESLVLPRRWVPRRGAEAPALEAEAFSLAAELSLPLPMCRLLVARGHGTGAGARRFLRPRIDQLLPPETLAGLPAAVERLRRALRQGETILVHGDYDVDGVCSAALYTRVLRSLGGHVVPFVPHRLRDGYDLGDAGLSRARERGATLLLTGDCGIVAHDSVRRAATAGIDVIVTDHHTPAAVLPDAVAVVNPKRADCAYPDKSLCGAGVAFKVCQALLAEEGGDQEALLYHLDLVALATIADLVPLRGENRVLAHYGLRVMRQSRKPGVRALVSAAGLDGRGALSAGQISHVLAPRINAAGRIGDSEWALRLLLTEDEREAGVLAERLEVVNRERREIDREMLAQALDQLERDFDPDRTFGIVLAAEGWHPGVIGIVASRVVENVHRPTALVALNGGHAARGSARSIRGFDLYAAVHACGEHLIRYGGHRQAAGFDVSPDRVDAFRQAFNAVAARDLAGHDLGGIIEYDLELPLSAATPELARMLAYLGPFGIGNPAPVFIARGITLPGPPRVVGSGHLSMRLLGGSASLRAIGFGLAERHSPVDLGGRTLDVAFQLQEDVWRGEHRVQARLVDLSVAG